MKYSITTALSISMAAMALTSCDNETPLVSLGIDDNYMIARMQCLPLESAFTGNGYRWILHRGERGDSIMSTSRRCVFVTAEEGVYNVTFEVIDKDSPYVHDFTINVYREEIEYSPYISKVFEYNPAPGQFVNMMPMYEEGDTYESMLQKAEDCISGKNDVMITLGAYGGYVTFGFDHTVMNLPGNDFRIYGNAFYELEQTHSTGGSAEPGIVMVSFDSNCNGLPDDEWYELKGSEYDNPATIHDYRITYIRPAADKQPVPDKSGTLTDSEYIPWRDSEGATGYVAQNTFHRQDYFPLWIPDNEISFSGSLLPPNGIDVSGRGTSFLLKAFPWGYVDNHPNDNADLNSFDIDMAVDSSGKRVWLPGISFVRVYTGVNQYCGWLGETSTEISKARDLHLPE